MDHDHPGHPKRHLRHLVVMRVVHQRAVLPEGPLVNEGLARLNGFLRESADAIHATRQQHAVPVDGRGGRQFVGDVNADAVAFDGFDHRTMHHAVVAPTIRHQPRSEFVSRDFLRDQVKDLHPIDDRPGQDLAVGNHHRLVMRAGLARFQPVLAPRCRGRRGQVHTRRRFESAQARPHTGE